MAKFELKFIDCGNSNINIKCNLFDEKEVGIIIEDTGKYVGSIYFDKSTAIKFAKTLRTEINKIVE
jgi:hypothetical protein